MRKRFSFPSSLTNCLWNDSDESTGLKTPTSLANTGSAERLLYMFDTKFVLNLLTLLIASVNQFSIKQHGCLYSDRGNEWLTVLTLNESTTCAVTWWRHSKFLGRCSLWNLQGRFYIEFIKLCQLIISFI